MKIQIRPYVKRKGIKLLYVKPHFRTLKTKSKTKKKSK